MSENASADVVGRDQQGSEVIRWGLYPWFPERGADFIHAEDLEAFKGEASNCKVFACVREGEYIIIYYTTPEFTILHWLDVYGWRYVVRLPGSLNC